MKKVVTIVLVLIFVLGLAGIALANRAEQFVDVPAKHWAYDAVGKLAKAGIIDGDNGKFLGDKPISRYEMAVIVAKAIANEEKADAENHAIIEKLSKEFSNELQTLGVRVSKLEKQVGTVKFGADARLAAIHYATSAKHDVNRMRFRLNLNSDINENTSFYGRIVLDNQAEMGTFYSNTTYSGADRVNVADIAFTRKNLFGPNTQVVFGRFTQQLDIVGGYWMFTNGGVDGVKVLAGNKLKVEAGYANFGPAYAQFSGKNVDSALGPRTGDEIKSSVFTKMSYPLSRATTIGGWWLKEMRGADTKWDVKSLNLSTKVAPNFTLAGDYGRNYIGANNYKKPIFYHYRLTYGGEKYTVPGSSSLAIEYYKFEPGSSNLNYTANMVGALPDMKAWAVLARKTLEKNLIGSVFYSWNIKKVSNGTSQPNYFRVQLDYLW